MGYWQSEDAWSLVEMVMKCVAVVQGRAMQGVISYLKLRNKSRMFSSLAPSALVSAGAGCSSFSL